MQQPECFGVAAASAVLACDPEGIPHLALCFQGRGIAYQIKGTGNYDDAFAATFITPMGNNGDQGRTWAGPRDDGFYVDLGGVFDLANLRGPGAAQDGVSGFNCHAIARKLATATGAP